MKILLDENLPHQMRLELPGHEVFTAAYAGFSGIENGELLRRAASAGFDVLVTNDRGLEYQQNISQLPLPIIALLASANTIEALRPSFPALLNTLGYLKPYQFVKLSIPC